MRTLRREERPDGLMESGSSTVTEQEAKPRRTGLVLLLIMLCAMSVTTTTIYLPAIPKMAQDLQATAGEIQATLSIYLVAYAVAQLLLGPLSDRYGRRPVLLLSLGAVVATSAACALAPSALALLGLRVLQAVGACSGVIIGRVIVRDLYDRSEAARLLSIIAASVTVAPAVGPAFGGLIADFLGWRYIFVFLALAAFGLLIWSAAALPETMTRRVGGLGLWAGIQADYRRLFASPAFLGYACCNFGIYGGFYTFMSGMPLIFVEGFGFSTSAYGLLAMVPIVGLFLGGVLNARLTVALGLDRMLDVSVLILAGAAVLGLVLLSFLATPWLVLGWLVLWTTAMGIIQPNALAGAMSIDPAIAGAAAALIGFLQIMGGGVGSAAMSIVGNASPIPMCATILGLSVVSAIGWTGFRRLGRSSPPLR